MHARWFIAPIVFLIHLCLALPSALAQQPGGGPRAAEIHEIESLFQRVTRSAPRRFHIVARIETLTPAWTEKQIREELERQEKIMARDYRDLPPAEREQLRTLMLDGIRKAHSGTNTWDVEVWVSGRLYRRDHIWTSIPYPSKYSLVYIGDPTFTNIPAFVVNRTIGSATLFTNVTEHPVDIDPIVWEAHGLEPPFYVPIILALADPGSINLSRLDPFRPFAHLNIDPSKATSLANGTHPTTELSVSVTNLNGERLKCFHLKPKGLWSALASMARYYVDPSNPDSLKRVELIDKDGEVQTSVREGSVAPGWPQVFTSQIKDPQGRLRTTRVVYTHVDLEPTFDDWSIFAPVFPTNYIVSVNPGQGLGHMIQNPNNAIVLPPPPAFVPSPIALLFVVGIALLLPPLIVLMRKSKPLP